MKEQIEIIIEKAIDSFSNEWCSHEEKINGMSKYAEEIEQLLIQRVSHRFFISKIRLIRVKAEKRKFTVSVIDLTDQSKNLKLMVIQLYFFSFGISYLLNEG